MLNACVRFVFAGSGAIYKTTTNQTQTYYDEVFDEKEYSSMFI